MSLTKAESKAIKRRDGIYASVLKILDKSKAIDIIDIKIQMYLDKLDELWIEFFNAEASLGDEFASLADDFSEKFYDAKANLLTLLNERNKKPRDASLWWAVSWEPSSPEALPRQC